MNWLLLLALLLPQTPSAAPAPTAEQPPNIILIIADDLGWGDVGCYGGDVETPHIDSLAEEGTRFTNFYVTSPVCTPSRYSIMTGRMPHRAKGGLNKVIMVLNPKHDHIGLRDGEKTMASALQEVGYRTALIGKWHLGGGHAATRPNQQGFDYFYGARGGCIDFYTHHYGILPDWYRNEEPVTESGYATDLLTKDAVKWLQQQNAEQPFFLCLSHFAPHFGKTIVAEQDVAGELLAADERTLVMRIFGTYPDLKTKEPKRLGNTLQVDEVSASMTDANGAPIPRQYFKQMVRSLDSGVGEVLAALEASPVGDNTIVIFMSDHGSDQTESSAGRNAPFRGAKHSILEGGIRIPMLVRWPDKLQPKSKNDYLGSTLDLYPTLLAAATASSHQPSQTAAPDPDGINALARWLGQDTSPNQRTLRWRLGKSWTLRHQNWKLSGNKLYNLETDSTESQNVAAKHPKVVKQLKSKVQDWMQPK